MRFQVKDKKKMINKLIKYGGNIITILAIVLIVKKLYLYDMDYSIIFSIEKSFFLIMILLIYMLIVFWGGIPWLGIVNALSECNIRYSEAVFIFVKSNILKYIPGNIFQYAGRNELAVDKKIKHSKVVLATLIDVVWNVFTMLFFSVIMSGNELIAWVREQQVFTLNSKTFIYGIAIICIIVSLIICIWRRQILKNVMHKVVSVKLLGVLAFNFIFYVFMGIISAGLYVAIFSLISGNVYSVHEVTIYVGIMLVALVAGFVTPGAPGGVGVREAASLFLLNGMIDETVILSGIIIMRIISIIGDLATYIAVLLFSKIKLRYRRENA